MNVNKEVKVVEMPVVSEVVISQSQLVYSSKQNKFLRAIIIVLICTDGQEYRYAIDPALAKTVFRIE